VTDPHDLLREDPRLGPVVEEHGEIALEPHPDPFERLVISIVNQQLSTASAGAIRDRLFDRYEVRPEAMLAAADEDLRDLGLSGQKIEYVRNVADRFQADGLAPETFATMTDEEVIEELASIKGIGVWTAKMFLIFVLAREDVFPVEDLGIRRGMEMLYSDGITRGEMVERAEAWRPYRSYASLYLWRHYEG
jgi:DNA-3-methyladenine glycosylase II